MNTFCKDYDPSNGKCTSCYEGYGLNDGKCIVGLDKKDQVNCKKF